jgi:hypothetical protein
MTIQSSVTVRPSDLHTLRFKPPWVARAGNGGIIVTEFVVRTVPTSLSWQACWRGVSASSDKPWMDTAVARHGSICSGKVEYTATYTVINDRMSMHLYTSLDKKIPAKPCDLRVFDFTEPQ